MKWNRTIALIPALSMVFFAWSAHAETVLRITDSISLSDDQVVDGDFYGAAEKVSLSGKINGDAHVAAGSVTSNGEIAEDLFALGGTVQVHASVTDDVRIVGGEATIAEHVGGDVFVIGGVLTVLSGAQIDGDVFFYGGEVELNGVVGGSVYGAAEKIRIDGRVGKDVNVEATNSLVLGDRADIGGDVQYQSRAELVRAQNAIVVGDIVKGDSRTETPVDPRAALVPFLMYAFSVLVVFAVFRNRISTLVEDTVEHFTKNGLVGIAGFVLMPFAVVLSLVTVIGFWVGMALLFALGFIFVFAMLLMPILVGVMLNRSFAKGKQVTLMWTLLGILSVSILASIPVLGWLIVFVLFLVQLGTLLTLIYRYLALQ